VPPVPISTRAASLVIALVPGYSVFESGYTKAIACLPGNRRKLSQVPISVITNRMQTSPVRSAIVNLSPPTLLELDLNPLPQGRGFFFGRIVATFPDATICCRPAGRHSVGNLLTLCR
jgi:hypothetical protein